MACKNSNGEIEQGCSSSFVTTVCPDPDGCKYCARTETAGFRCFSRVLEGAGPVGFYVFTISHLNNTPYWRSISLRWLPIETNLNGPECIHLRLQTCYDHNWTGWWSFVVLPNQHPTIAPSFTNHSCNAYLTFVFQSTWRFSMVNRECCVSKYIALGYGP